VTAGLQGKANLQQSNSLSSDRQEIVISQGTKRFFKHFLSNSLKEKK